MEKSKGFDARDLNPGPQIRLQAREREQIFSSVQQQARNRTAFADYHVIDAILIYQLRYEVIHWEYLNFLFIHVCSLVRNVIATNTIDLLFRLLFPV